MNLGSLGSEERERVGEPCGWIFFLSFVLISLVSNHRARPLLVSPLYLYRYICMYGYMSKYIHKMTIMQCNAMMHQSNQSIINE